MVDDVPEVIKLLTFILNREGYQVVGITKSTEVLDILEKEFFPVIISDIMMPGIGGLELLKIINEKYPDSQVIMITAANSIDLAVKALSLGAFAYLTKPIKQTELKIVVERAFENYELILQKESLEDKLRRVQDKKKEVYTMLFVDYQGKIKNTNKATEIFLEYEKGELSGQSVDIILGIESGVSLLQGLDGKLDNYEMKLITKNGGELKVDFDGKVLKDKDRNLIGIMGMFTNIRGG
jgi:CheY-like chemotaxis protein